MVDVKFCGLTRAADAECAASLGAAYLGVVFAEGPRLRTPAEAAALFTPVANEARVRRVGVFGAQGVDEVATIAATAGLHVVQLHGHAPPEFVAALRRVFAGEVWRVVRVRGAAHEAVLRDAAAGVEGVVVDTLVDGRLGGTGVALDWGALAGALEQSGRPARLVLAGGLTPANVADAVRLLAPDVVDVSSGVESAPGIKDHERMRAFVDAVQGSAG